MTRLAITVALAVITPVRRGLTWVEGRLVYARYRLRDAGAMFIVLAVVIGCGGVERHARTALDVTAHGVVAADSVVATVYERRAAEAREASLAAHPGADQDDAVRADYRDRMNRLDAAVVALRTTRIALIDAQAVLDADGDVLPTIGCVGVALAHLVEALREAGVDPPAKLTQALGAIADLATPLCGDGGGS